LGSGQMGKIKFKNTKMKHCFNFKCLLMLVFVAFQLNSNAQIKLPNLISNGMVLQRNQPVKIWGWSSPKEKIEVRFVNKKYKTTADEKGNWNLELAAHKEGGPYEMTLKGKNQILISDILYGDVWFCSGQSNMVHQVELHKVRYADEVDKANFPEIRHLTIPTLTDLNGEKNDLPVVNWKTCNPSNVLQFSAVAYFFAKQLYEKYHIPIGLINSSVGGTPIEAWISENGLKEFPKLQSTIQKNRDTNYLNSFKTSMNAPKKMVQGDQGLINMWYDISYIPKGWRNINIPGFWEDQGIKNLDGNVWYRKEIEVPTSMTNEEGMIFLGRIVDADAVYINGKFIGGKTYQYPQRRYVLEKGILHPGKNSIVIRVTNTFGKGGFVPDKPYCIKINNQTLDLKGEWQYKVGEVFESQKQNTSPSFSAQDQPNALFNAMVAPLTNFAIKGFIWYQGESNVSRSNEYEQLQIAQINDWRKKWNQENTPFLYVQLPGFQDMNYLPSESQMAELRNAQLKALSVKATGMAIAVDLGEWNDIHPDRKKEVGDRLALLANKIAYHENDMVSNGPIWDSYLTDANKITVSFSNSGTGLISNDGEDLRYFAIAGEDKKFVWAKAIIENNKVIIWNDAINHPKYVRYAWADNPDDANLYNKELLPASPFEIIIK
jgi:sialate O-acetylesterase